MRRYKTVLICRWPDYVCRNPKKSTNKLELISDFSKIAEYKINTEKAIVFVYINNEHAETKINLVEVMVKKITALVACIQEIHSLLECAEMQKIK